MNHCASTDVKLRANISVDEEWSREIRVRAMWSKIKGMCHDSLMKLIVQMYFVRKHDVR